MIKRFHKENLISKNITEGLKIESPKSPHFHLKIKLHKEGVTRYKFSKLSHIKISEYVDYHLQPIVREIRSYVKDTSEFLRKISAVEFVPDNYLVSLDVKSIYTNIPSAEVIKAVKESLENHPKRAVATKVITTFLALILTLDFIFNSRNYLQAKACAMGTICAPSYANIFMDHFEKKLIYPFIKGFLFIYLRFIDDLFFIWTGNKKDLMKFLNELDTKHESIKFEYQISKTSITFLDPEAYIKNSKLYTKIYRKQTDCQTFLNINSEHAKSLKTSIPYSQALRIKRICSKTTDFEHHL